MLSTTRLRLSLPRVGFIGYGNMARAIASGLSKSGKMTELGVRDPRLPDAEDVCKLAPDVLIAESTQRLVTECPVIVLAIKPQIMEDVLPTVQFTPNTLVVSVVAGWSIERLTETCKGNPRIVRCMPNLPAKVGLAASAVAGGPTTTRKDIDLVTEIMNTCGVTVEVAENLFDAVTGVSGSGASFTAVFIEALADGGVLMGLPRDTALKLAAQTVMGTGALAASGIHPALLKDQVCSPGGTSIHGVSELEKLGLRTAVVQAVGAADSRSKELSKL